VTELWLEFSPSEYLTDTQLSRLKRIPHDNVPTLCLYEYPSMEGTPLERIAPDAAIVKNPYLLAHWRECQCLLGVEQEAGGVQIVGGVYKYSLNVTKPCMHVLVSCGDATHLSLKRDEVAQVLLNVTRPYFLEHYEEPWVDFLDVVLLFQYESKYRLAFMVEDIPRRFLPQGDARGTFFRLGQMILGCIDLNASKEYKALRRAFEHALPQLLPGVTVAEKKPGYAANKGYADCFLERQGALMPTQLRTDPVSPQCVESLRTAIRGYKAETGYFFAPGMQEGVILDANMIFVHFAPSIAEDVLFLDPQSFDQFV
jgi:hypothetical protein